MSDRLTSGPELAVLVNVPVATDKLAKHVIVLNELDKRFIRLNFVVHSAVVAQLDDLALYVLQHHIAFAQKLVMLVFLSACVFAVLSVW